MRLSVLCQLPAFFNMRAAGAYVVMSFSTKKYRTLLHLAVYRIHPATSW